MPTVLPRRHCDGIIAHAPAKRSDIELSDHVLAVASVIVIVIGFLLLMVPFVSLYFFTPA